MENNEETILLSEYNININFIEDFFKYSQKYRESYYKLNNTLFTYKKLLKENCLQGELEILIEAENALKCYQEIDSVLAIDADDIKEIAATKVEDTIDTSIELNESVKILVESIKGKSKLESIQYRLLENIFSIYSSKNDEILKTNPIQGRSIRDKRISLQMNYIRDDKHTRNRYDTFVISFDSLAKTKKERNQLDRELKEINLSNPFYVSKIRNYEYLIKEEAEKVEIEIMNFLEANDKIEDDKKIKIDRRKNNLQLTFNIIVGISTFISLIISILTFIYKD